MNAASETLAALGIEEKNARAISTIIYARRS